MQTIQEIFTDPNRRTKQTHPYSYDPFVMWRIAGEPDDSVYSDRLYQWDIKKHNTLCQKHFGNEAQYWADRDPKVIEAFLRDYLELPELILREIEEHCNQASGYPCWKFAFQKIDRKRIGEQT